MVRLLGLTSSTTLSGPTAAHKSWPSKTTPVKTKNSPGRSPARPAPSPGYPGPGRSRCLPAKAPRPGSAAAVARRDRQRPRLGVDAPAHESGSLGGAGRRRIDRHRGREGDGSDRRPDGSGPVDTGEVGVLPWLPHARSIDPSAHKTPDRRQAVYPLPHRYHYPISGEGGGGGRAGMAPHRARVICSSITLWLRQHRNR